MSTRISRALALALALGGCAAQLVATDTAVVRVAGQDVTVVAPPGACIDSESLDVTRAGAFLLISDCALEGGAINRPPPLNAVVSASVSTGGLPGTLAELEDFLTGPGLVTLGKSGEFDKIRVLSTRRQNDILFIKVEDLGESPIPGAAPRFWRGFFDVNGRLIGAQVVSFLGAELSDAEATAIIARFAGATRAANPPPLPDA